jgi:hypothetical protein
MLVRCLPRARQWSLRRQSTVDRLLRRPRCAVGRWLPALCLSGSLPTAIPLTWVLVGSPRGPPPRPRCRGTAWHGMAWHMAGITEGRGRQRQDTDGSKRGPSRWAGGANRSYLIKRAARVRARARARSAIRHGWVFVTVHGLALHGPSRVTVWSLTTTTQPQPAASQRVFARLHRQPHHQLPSARLTMAVGSTSSTCQQHTIDTSIRSPSQNPPPPSIHLPSRTPPHHPSPVSQPVSCGPRNLKTQSTHSHTPKTQTHLAHPAPTGSLNKLDRRYETAYLIA